MAMAAVILNKKRDRLSLYLVLSTIGVGLWNISNAFADLAWNNLTARIWCGFALIGSMFFIVFYVIFLEQFLTQRSFKNYVAAIFILIPAIFFSSVSFSRIYITEIIIQGTAPAITIPGKINYFILVYSLLIIFYGLWRLQSFYASLSLVKRKQILYVKAGFIISLCAGIIFTIIFPFLGNFMLFSLAAQFTILSVVLTMYTMYKHNFLDINIIIQRGLVYTLLLGLVIFFYLATLFIVQSLFFNHGQILYLIVAIITCAVGIFSVPKIDAWLRRLTDKLFFKDKYDPATVLKELSETLNSNLDLRDLVLKTTNILKKNLKIKDIYFEFLPSDCTQALQKLEDLQKKYDSYVMLRLEKLEKTDKLLGVLFLSPKLSGDGYSDTDSSLLNIFAHHMTLALEKSQLYEQVKDYSKNLEIKIEQRMAELKQLQEKQSQELFDIAHQLQTPLTVLKGQVQILAADLQEKDKTQLLETNVDRISQFVSGLLKLARLDFEGEQRREKINFSELLSSLVEEFSVIAQESRIVFEHDIEKNIFVMGDTNKLTELVSNLVSNAMKYIAHERRVVINLKKVDAWARLEIIDTGAGISAEDLSNLFKRFYRGHTAAGSGTGLGLAICKKIIDVHQGNIRITSELHKGTQVEVLLPLA